MKTALVLMVVISLAFAAGACKKKTDALSPTPATPATAGTAKTPPPRTAIVTEGPLNLREEAGTKGTIVGRLSQGEKVIILEKSATAETIDGKAAYWYKVETVDKKQGWVFGGYLDVGAAEAPVGTATTAGTAHAAGTPSAVINVAAASEAGWTAAQYYKKGKELADAGRYANALPYLKASQEQSPQTGAYWFELGLALQELGRDAEAATAYENAVTLMPSDFWAHNNLGLACIKAGYPRRAVEVLEKALTLEPKGTTDAAAAKKTARANLATAYQLNGQPEKAEGLR